MSESPVVPSEAAAFPPLEEIKAEPVAAPITPLALALAVVSLPVAALVVGGIWHFVAYLADIPIVFPIFAGCGAGWAVGTAMKMGRAKSHKWAAWLGLAAALFTMLSRQCWDANANRPLMVEELTARIAAKRQNVPPVQIRRTVEAALTPWNTLRLHLESKAYVGTTLQFYYRSAPVGAGQSPRIRGGWYWGLLAVNVAFAGFAGAFVAEHLALRRYCPECGKSLKQYLLFQRKEDQIDAMLSLARAQDWDALKSLPQEKTTSKSRVAVTLLQCEEGGCPATVVVEQTSDGSPNRRFLNAWISPESAKAARAASFSELL